MIQALTTATRAISVRPARDGAARRRSRIAMASPIPICRVTEVAENTSVTATMPGKAGSPSTPR